MARLERHTHARQSTGPKVEAISEADLRAHHDRARAAWSESIERRRLLATYEAAGIPRESDATLCAMSPIEKWTYLPTKSPIDHGGGSRAPRTDEPLYATKAEWMAYGAADPTNASGDAWLELWLWITASLGVSRDRALKAAGVHPKTYAKRRERSGGEAAREAVGLENEIADERKTVEGLREQRSMLDYTARSRGRVLIPTWNLDDAYRFDHEFGDDHRRSLVVELERWRRAIRRANGALWRTLIALRAERIELTYDLAQRCNALTSMGDPEVGDIGV
ncbi:MAG: hypothetical protein NT062_36225 [Proteobacteria bacterium]|nr:hypothetical protein [Pseudomonadota bacterium]